MRAILTFHAVDDLGPPLSFPPQRFAALMEELAESGVPVVDIETLLGGDAPGVALTFDDGYASLFTDALPELARHGFPAHVFLATGLVAEGSEAPAGERAMLSWEMIDALARGGVRIEAHTASHADLRQLGDAEIRAELAQAGDAIEGRTGRRPRYFAYPFGRYDARVRAIAERVYDACFTTRLGYLPAKIDAGEVPRIDTYYLRFPGAGRRLLAPSTVAYIGLRDLIRRVQRKT